MLEMLNNMLLKHVGMSVQINQLLKIPKRRYFLFMSSAHLVFILRLMAERLHYSDNGKFIPPSVQQCSKEACLFFLLMDES